MQIDYYQLTAEDADSQLRFACQLSAKVWRSGHRLLIQCDNEAALARVDRMLWSFQSAAFVPHGPLAECVSTPPVALVCGAMTDADAPDHNDCLLLLNSAPPDTVERFNRLLYLLPTDPNGIARARDHYRRMQTHGHQLQHHRI